MDKVPKKEDRVS